ncbi:hypothetical protein ACET3X_004913 [Alternaria dauci]|uniref:UBC core domain-containing protein n=1 Tax=Alternaria dauci TaxID=48095 RepID=A0ABR3UIR9_9PLEO
MGYGGHGYDLHEESDYDTDDFEEGDYSGNLDDPDYMPSVSKGSAHTLGHILNLKEPKRETKVSEAQKVQICEDVFSNMVLGFLTNLLPSLERETCFDFDPPKAVLKMLRNSKILQYCAELLRNDSLADVIKRKDLYQTLFNFLMTVGLHGETSAALFGPRFVRPETVDLLTLSFCAAAPDPSESVSILAECLRNLTTQSAMVLLSAKNNGKYFKNQEGQQMLRVCRNISALSQFIQDQTPVEAGSKKGKETAIVPEDLAVREVEESLMERTYYYYKQAKALESSRPGRFKRLVTEITTLQTSLPPGIFVRYCENRPDILKCVIVGPMGTPYENGLFEFDFFCPAEYPNVPPLANFKGTAGGRISINPNLYAEGKVCLSLLGTWSGEPWKPGESTLLQVLISIQAMILCDEPWYNEPGREAGYTRSLNSPSAMYNSKIREHTVRTAIMAWLEYPKPIWKDVVDHHFNEHGNTILKTVEEWTKDKRSPVKRPRPEVVPDDDGLYDYDDIFNTVRGQPDDVQDMGTMLFRIQRMLKERYRTTFEVTYVPPVKKPTPPPATPRRLNLSSSPWTMFGPPPLDTEASASGAPPLGFASPALAPPSSLSPSSSATDSIGFYQQQLAAAAATPGRGGYAQAIGRGAFSGGHSFLSNNPYKSDGSVAMPNTQGGSSMGLPSVAPRYDTRSTTRGRGEHGINPGMRGGRGGSSLGTPLLPSGANVNMGRGRGNITIGYGGLTGLGRGHGTGEGDIQGGQANTFAPFFPPAPTNFGRGRGAAPPGDSFTLGDLSSGTRGRGFAGGRGARGGRGGRGRGRGRGGRGDGCP